jgi:hypothetical protein
MFTPAGFSAAAEWGFREFYESVLKHNVPSSRAFLVIGGCSSPVEKRL